MLGNSESSRRITWDDRETEKKRKSCCRQSEPETKPQKSSMEPAEWTPMARRGPALRPSLVRAAGARHPNRLLQLPRHAAPIDFQNQSATSRDAGLLCCPQPCAYRKSVRLRNVRLLSGHPRRRAAPLLARADTLGPTKSELCSLVAQGRQVDWP